MTSGLGSFWADPQPMHEQERPAKVPAFLSLSWQTMNARSARSFYS